MRWLLAILITCICCGDAGPPTFTERIPEMSDVQRHRYCYNCQDKCFRDYQRVANNMDDWHNDWKKCLTGCAQRYMMDADDCQYTDKEYIIHRKPREVPKQRIPRTGG
jgi:hypothetical protein